MKRLILRIAALGTVVILGLIAIAQAQRGAEDSPPPGAHPLRKARVESKGNPLRRKNGPLRTTDETPPLKLLAAEQQAAPAKGPRRKDPFGLHAHQSEPASGPADGKVVRASNETPKIRPPEGPRYPQPTNPRAEARPSIPALPAAGQNESPAAPGRYPDLQRATTDGQEPATLKLDPLAPLASILQPGRPSGGRAAHVPPNGEATNRVGLADAELASTGTVPTGEGTGQPGSKQLEGPQTPQLTIQKSAPEEIQVGRPATFRLTVRNTGSIAAGGVEVRDRIPKGTRLLGTSPRASRGARGELVWTLGTIKPGDESSFAIQLEPITEGEIGSVATVSFSADASARCIATRPELVVESSAPGQVLIGEEITLTIEISNPGSGVATGVVLEEHIPSGLQHPAGTNLEYEIGKLEPGESRKLELTLLASRPGPVTNVLTARGEANLRTEDRLNLEVVAPLLDVTMAGPKRRYLEREATYRLSVNNPGTAAAKQVELVAYLPTGLKFVSANNAGHYEESDRTVHWRLEELPVGETGMVQLVTMPIEAGQQTIRLRGTADKVSPAEEEQPVLVEGIAAIMFEVIDVTDPIEVEGETMYEIRVLNQGSKAATNVRLAVLLPPEMQAVAAEGPTRHVVDGGRVLFDGLARLAPKADTTYRVRVMGLQPGDLRVRVQLQTAEMQSPVTKEESTRVYSDE